MNINEFSEVCKKFFAEHDDFKGVIHILSDKPDSDNNLIGFSGMKGKDAEILGMCLIMCDKAGISMREVAMITKTLANDPDAMAALANINRDSDDDEEKDDEPQEKKSQEKKECCGKCNRKESDKKDSEDDDFDPRKALAKMLIESLFND